MSTMQQRYEAVQETIGRVVAIERAKGVTRAAIEAIKEELISLAGRSELFPEAEFSGSGNGGLYRLAEDENNNFALYAVVGTAGRSSPVHDHTTWAVIAGVRGAEHNRFYERTDNRSTPGIGSLRQTGEHIVVPGSAVGYLPEDFHAIEMVGDGPWVQLHLYGRSLEHLPGRIKFATTEGGAYEVYPASPQIAAVELPPAVVKAAIGDGEEVALLDVREEAAFSEGHLLFASSAPLSRLEIEAPALVPRRGSRVVVIDGAGNGLAQRAARLLFDAGWKNIAVLKGGVEAWGVSGYVVFSGVNVPSKAFGELVERECGTPHVGARELQRRLDEGEEILLLDSRPFDEFTAMSIPGGIDAPGVELLGRAQALLRSPATPVVVNCAGRTRSIIGAQLLINAGLPNPVAALKDGTMGWHLAGLALAHGETRIAPSPGPDALERARGAAAALAQRCAVRSIDHAGLAAFREAAAARALFCFDVRLPEEYRAGHLPGFRHAAGGQLVQATDIYVGTLRSRIVLADDDGVRARLTASWLVQLGWDDTFVLDNAHDRVGLQTGLEAKASVAPPEVATVTPTELQALIAGDGAELYDLAVSREYRRGHVPGAIWVSRPRLPELLAARAVPGRPVVLVSPDGILARFAAAEQAAGSPVLALAGGLAAWRRAGFPVQQESWFAHPPVDVWRRPDDGSGTPEGSMRGYLAWETALPELIARDGDARIRIIPPAAREVR